MGGTGRDLRHAVRALAAQPGFTAVAVLTLGLGVGATTAMFSAVHAVLLRPLPYRDAGEVVVVQQTNRVDGSVADGVSAANLRDAGAMAHSLSGVSLADGPHGLRWVEDGRAFSLRSWWVSERFFEVMGGRALLGRTFVPEEFVPGGERVVLVSHHLWRNRFGGASDMVGRELRLDGVAHVVVGVLPPEFTYPTASDTWTPRPPQPADDAFRERVGMHGVARLAPGVTVNEAQAELDRVAAQLAEAHPAANADLGFRLVPLRRHLIGHLASPLWLLLGAVGLVLSIAVANVAGLQVARGVGRTREYALRAALGADSRRILRFALVESLVVAGAGGLLGIGLAHLGVDLIRLVAPTHLPRFDALRLDAPVLAFALVVAVGSALLAGIAPAVRASKLDPHRALTDGARGTTRGAKAGTLRDRLVVAQIASALMLTVGAGLLVRSFDRLLDNDLGFTPEGRLAAQVWAYDDTHQQQLEFFDRAVREIAAVPGVEAVGLTTNLPLADDQSILSRGTRVEFTIDDRPSPAPGGEPVATVVAINEAYPGSMGIPLGTGRAFTSQDHATSPPVMMVNEAFVRRHFQERDPLGQRVTLRWRDGLSREIVGVLSDVRREGFESDPRPELYVPLRQEPANGLTFVVRTAGDPASFAGPVQDAMWAADPGQAAWAARPLTDLLQGWIRQRRFNTVLLVTFAGLALSLSAVGVYGLMSFSVAQRVNELGIRQALGGTHGDIVRLILRRGVGLSLTGAGLGLIGAIALTRLLRGMLFGVAPLDLVTFAVVSTVVIGVALLAAFLPARRATRVDPMAALRIE